MAWEEVLDRALDPNQQARKRSLTGFLGTLSDSMRRATMTPEQRMAAALNPLRAEAMRLQSKLYQSQLDDLTRERTEKAATPAAEQRVLEGFAARSGSIDRSGAMNLDENPEAAGTPAPVDPGRKTARQLMELIQRGVPSRDIGLVEKYSPSLYKSMGLKTPEEIEKTETETVTVPRGSTVIRKKSGQPVAEGAPPIAMRKVIEGEDGWYTIALDDQGNLIGEPTALGIKKPGKVPNQGERNESRAAAILRSRGIQEGSPEWDEGMYILTNPTPSVENVGIFSRLDVLGQKARGNGGGTAPAAGGQAQPPGSGGAPAPRISADRPLSPEQTRSMASTEVLDGAVKILERASADPNTQAYRGPIGRWLSTPQRWTAAVGMTPEVPENVVDLEQNLKILNTETRRMATGAQMSAYEADDIMGQLPRQQDNPQEFARRLENTKRNIGIMRQMQQAGLTDQQRAKLKRELGVRSAPASDTTFETLPPAAQFKDRMMEDPKTGLRVKSDGKQWLPVAR